jgi:hypothetical protein
MKDASDASNFEIVTKYKPLLGMSGIENGKSVVLVERLWGHVLSNLPEVLFRRKFNT